MLTKNKIYTILFSLVALICLAGFIWSYTVTKDLIKPEGGQKGKAQVVSVKNLVLTETKEGELYWELYATKGSYDGSSGNVILQNALGNFYNSDKEVVLSFKADIGEYSENTKVIVMRGNTLVVANDGSSISADEIIFKGKEDDITAKGNVVVRRNQDFISTANKARFSSQLDFFEISGNTKTDVFSKDKIKVQELVN